MKTVTRHPSVGRTPWSARDPLVAPSRPCSALSCGRACRVVVVARASACRVGTPADAWIAFFCVDTPIDARYEQTL